MHGQTDIVSYRTDGWKKERDNKNSYVDNQTKLL